MPEPAGAGSRAAAHRVRSGLAVALDLGASKLAGAVVTRRGSLRHRRHQRTAGGSRQASLEQLLEVASELLSQAEGPAEGLGVSVPAVVDPHSGVVEWAPNLPGWREVPLRQYLESRLGLPVWVDFDGHLATLGEHWKGAGRNSRNMVCVIVGSGIGGGMILGGRLHRGARNIAGAFGWMVVDPRSAHPGEARARGALESLASGPALARAFGAQGAEAVVEAARGGDRRAQEAVDQAAHHLGLAVASLVSALNPEVVVLGGGLGSSGALREGIQRAVAAHAQPVCAHGVRIEVSALGEAANLLGAAWMVFKRAGKEVEMSAAAP